MAKIKKTQGQPKFNELELQILKFWKEKDILDQSINQRPENKSKAFYDGPLTANGLPHHGHMLTFAVKDLFPRYWAMKGYRVPRSLGWDCQGIPVEYEIEKKLEFKEKKDIEKFGVAKFNELCRQSVEQYKSAMVDFEERMGRLTNNDEEYQTMDRNYIESIWWSLKELSNKGLLYEGFKVVPYSTRAGTTLSNAEVSLGGYKPYVDPAVTVKFELVDEPGTFVLAWTTTPWTLPTNFGLAIGEKFDYVKVESNGEKYILAKECLKTYFPEDIKYESVSINELIKKSYKPLFNFFPNKENAYKIYFGFHVTTDSGTGVVHLAPYGVEDNEIFKEVGIQSVDVLNEQGDYTDLVPMYQGMNYRDANPKIIEYLKEHNLLFKAEDYTHDMPMCWRTNTPLIYKPIVSWYIGMSTLREELVENNNKINWTPAHVKEGRFGNWLSEIKDWGISRLRYWGTPLPIWKSESGKTIIIGSFEELEKYSGKKIDDPHKPFIDEFEFDFEGEHYKRIPDVLDVWYDSGAMPFARFHYPFENREKFENKFPAEFIAEGVDQTRGWFYSLHALGTALFNSEAFKNVVMNGFILDDKGVKLSKSKKNYSSPNELFEKFGADTLRVNFFNTPIVAGEDTTVSEKTLKIYTQEVMLPLWNIYTYLSTYAEIHNWDPSNSLVRNERKSGDDQKWDHIPFENIESVMDEWMLVRLQETIKKVTSELDTYNIQKAVLEIRSLIDDISKWYIRRSRDRFVEGNESALSTLYYVYVELLKVLSPFTPFITEKIYKDLVLDVVADAKESIHLTDYPEFDLTFYEKYSSQIDQMKIVQSICSLGQNLRTENGLKLRQPLAKAIVDLGESKLSDERLIEIIKEELNLKEVKFGKHSENEPGWISKTDGKLSVSLNTNLTEELKEEGLVKEFTRSIQALRKTSGFKVGESIVIVVEASDEIQNMIERNLDEVKNSVVAKEVRFENLPDEKPIKVNEFEVKIKLER